MGEITKIQWTHRTRSPWRGCVKVSDGCDHCYAEAGSGRNPAVLGKWGAEGVGTRTVLAEAGWAEMLKWDKEAKALGERHRVFPSVCDPFEAWGGPMQNHRREQMMIEESTGFWSSQAESLFKSRPLTMDDVRERYFDLIGDTPNLVHLLLTKRPENLEAMLPWTSEHAGEYRERAWDNVWLGTSVENRSAKARIDILRDIPAAVRFLSIEPLLEHLGPLDLTGIHWVIVGGEPGDDARCCHTSWIRDVARQCREQGVACFVKQLGKRPQEDCYDEWGDVLCEWPVALIEGNFGYPVPVLRDKKHGGDPSEWPADLHVREFPNTVTV